MVLGMADSIDAAQVESDKHLECILANRVILNPLKVSASDCVECGDLIPNGRQLAIPGVDTCVSCQTIIEMKARR